MKRNLSWLQNNKIHIITWAIYIVYESFLIGFLYSQMGHPITYIVHYALNIYLFYFHAHKLLPWALKHKQNVIWLIPLAITVQLVVYAFLLFIIDYSLIDLQIITHVKKIAFTKNFILGALYRSMNFVVFSTGYYFFRNYAKERKRTEELEKQRLNDIIKQQQTEKELVKAHNAFLKAQINPHFLFNTLDFVYHNVNEQSPIAGEAIISLSQMMRYAIDSDKMGEFTLLGDEIEQVENLIYLYQIRKDHQLEISFDYSEAVRSIALIPLILLTLVENIFKHGNLTTPGHSAEITLAVLDDTLYLSTENLIGRASKLSNNAGLANIEKRLRYAYGPSLSFSYGAEANNHFRVDIGIPLSALKGQA